MLRKLDLNISEIEMEAFKSICKKFGFGREEREAFKGIFFVHLNLL